MIVKVVPLLKIAFYKLSNIAVYTYLTGAEMLALVKVSKEDIKPGLITFIYLTN